MDNEKPKDEFESLNISVNRELPGVSKAILEEKTAPAPYRQFPKMLYHPLEGQTIVKNEEAMYKLLAQGWHRKPIDAKTDEIRILEQEILDMTQGILDRKSRINQIKGEFGTIVAMTEKIKEINDMPKPPIESSQSAPEAEPCTEPASQSEPIFPSSAKTCSEPGCGEPYHAKGKCFKHYVMARAEEKRAKKTAKINQIEGD